MFYSTAKCVLLNSKICLVQKSEIFRGIQVICHLLTTASFPIYRVQNIAVEVEYKISVLALSRSTLWLAICVLCLSNLIQMLWLVMSQKCHAWYKRTEISGLSWCSQWEKNHTNQLGSPKLVPESTASVSWCTMVRLSYNLDFSRQMLNLKIEAWSWTDFCLLS